MTNMKSRFIGSMVGSALGNTIDEIALQEPVKDLYYTRVDSSEIPRLVSQQRYTDDTLMAIGVAESLVNEGGFNYDDMATRFCTNHLTDKVMKMEG